MAVPSGTSFCAVRRGSFASISQGYLTDIYGIYIYIYIYGVYMVYIWCVYIYIHMVLYDTKNNMVNNTGWWLSHPSEKNEDSSIGMIIPNIWTRLDK